MTSGIVYKELPLEEAARLRRSGVHVCQVPAGTASLDALHGVLSRGLRFPAHYGANWDALDEMLADLSWLPNRVAIVHEDLPRVETSELVIYLRIVRDASVEAAARGRQLTCVVPPLEAGLERMLHSGENLGTVN